MFPDHRQEIIEDLEGLHHRKLWKPFMEKYNCQIICEVGIRSGDNFRLMIEHQPKVAVAIDSWVEDGFPYHNDMAYSQEELDQQYQTFAETYGALPNVEIYRQYSSDAVKKFPNNYFDLVYIDADHSYEGCYQDITNWFQKVKPGKFLVGDDFVNSGSPKTGGMFGVIEAVNRFSEENHLNVYKLPHFGWAVIK